MTKTNQYLCGLFAAGALGLATSLLPTGHAFAQMEVIVVKIDPATTQTCMQRVDELRNEARNTAGTALVVAFAEEAGEACRAEEFSEAEAALADGYRWLRKKQARNL